MNREERVEDILGLTAEDYVRGVAEVSADMEIIERLKADQLIDMNSSLGDAPTVEEFCNFLRKHNDREIELRLLVTSPKREDFRIVVKGVLFDPEYVKLNTTEDMMFWKDFMDLGRESEASMVDSETHVGWQW